MKRTSLVFGLIAASTLVTSAASAQQVDRAANLQGASVSFDFREAVGLLMPVLDPGLAGQDSLWAVGVKAMASALLDGGLENAASDPDLAGLWLRWGVRVAGALPLDPVYDVEALRAAYAEARASVAEDELAEAGVETEWEWTPSFDGAAAGRLAVELTAGDARSPSFTIDGRARSLDEVADLPPGTYRIEVAAGGYESLVVEREVLPGVTTRILVDAVPAMWDEARSLLAPRVVQLAYRVDGARVCGNALALAPTTIVARPATVGLADLELVGASGGARLAGATRVSDADDMGVALAIANDGGEWPTYATAQVGQDAWAMYRDACSGPLQTARVRLQTVQGSEAGFDRSIAAEAIGGALLDREGGVLGVVAGADRARLFTSQAQLFLQQAIVAMNTVTPPSEPQISTSGGGPPWKLVGGAGAAGIVALLLLTGGDPPIPPTTGTIVGVVPGG